ncbi:LytTR family DNA-binding domain-containing protein, partial [Phascolarctobacterium faecium]
RLQATVIKLQKVLQNQSQQQLPSRCNFPIKLSIWNNNKLLVFNPKEEIYLIKTDTSKKILIYTNKGILESNLPLKTLEEKLCPCGFLRTHKSYIVNMNKVREIIPWFNDTYILTVENCLEKEIPVSRHFIQSFKTFLNL